MRQHIAPIVLMLALSHANAWAQQTGASLPAWSVAPRTGSTADGWPHDPLPQFGVPPRAGRPAPLPQIGLPLPPTGLRSPERPRRFRRHWTGSVAPWPYVIVVPEFVAPAASAVPPPAPVVEAKGSLVLDVQPVTAQVFVDGYYSGTVDEFSGRRGGAFLAPGPHTIDVWAQGHEPLRFDVRIVPNEAIIYRRALTTIESKPAAPLPPARTPTTIYMIPGCYVGNVPPRDAGLPATCDLTQVRTFVM